MFVNASRSGILLLISHFLIPIWLWLVVASLRFVSVCRKYNSYNQVKSYTKIRKTNTNAVVQFSLRTDAHIFRRWHIVCSSLCVVLCIIFNKKRNKNKKQQQKCVQRIIIIIIMSTFNTDAHNSTCRQSTELCCLMLTWFDLNIRLSCVAAGSNDFIHEKVRLHTSTNQKLCFDCCCVGSKKNRWISRNLMIFECNEENKQAKYSWQLVRFCHSSLAKLKTHIIMINIIGVDCHNVCACAHETIEMKIWLCTFEQSFWVSKFKFGKCGQISRGTANRKRTATTTCTILEININHKWKWKWKESKIIINSHNRRCGDGEIAIRKICTKWNMEIATANLN